jgi:hypothetical protein
MGSLNSNARKIMRWRTIDGEITDPLGEYQDLETLNKRTF